MNRWGATFMGAFGVLTVACGRGAVDSNGSPPTASAATTTQGGPAAPNAWAIAELHQHRDLPAAQLVSVQGVLKEFRLCGGGCPAGAACAPCASSFSIGVQRDSRAEASVGFINDHSLMSEAFRVGQRYVFTGTLREWRDPSAGDPTFVNFDYVSHRALD
jgi:hypothetical protein